MCVFIFYVLKTLFRTYNSICVQANWSAFAPDFKELEENIEYTEREDEFDVVDAATAASSKENAQDEDVDVFTIEKLHFGSRFEAVAFCFVPSMNQISQKKNPTIGCIVVFLATRRRLTTSLCILLRRPWRMWSPKRTTLESGRGETKAARQQRAPNRALHP